MTSDAEMPAVLFPVNLLQAAREAEKTTLCEPQRQGVFLHPLPPRSLARNQQGGYIRNDGALAPSLAVGMQEVVGLRED